MANSIVRQSQNIAVDGISFVEENQSAEQNDNRPIRENVVTRDTNYDFDLEGLGECKNATIYPFIKHLMGVRSFRDRLFRGYPI